MDGTIGGGSGVSKEEEKARLAAMDDTIQTRDAVRRYRWLSRKCFSECVKTFYRKSLGKVEGDCVRTCVRKYQLLTSTTDARFRDLVTSANEARFPELADPVAAASVDDDKEE